MARKSRKVFIKEYAKPTASALPDTAPAAKRVYKTAIYVRLSVLDVRKKQSEAIETQKAMLVNFLNSRPDLQLYGIYEDVSFSGTNFDRPAFSRMLGDIRAGAADCVLVKDGNAAVRLVFCF